MDNVSMGSRIRQARLAAGMTQKQLADQLHITDRAVSKWERGLPAPDLALLEPLAQLLGLSLAQLIIGSEEEHPAPEEVAQKTVEYAKSSGAGVLHRIYSLTATSFGAQMIILLVWVYMEGWAFSWLTGLFALAQLCGTALACASFVLLVYHLLMERRTTFLEAVLGFYPMLLILAVCRFETAMIWKYISAPVRILWFQIR